MFGQLRTAKMHGRQPLHDYATRRRTGTVYERLHVRLAGQSLQSGGDLRLSLYTDL